MYNDLAYAPFGEQYAQSGSTGVTDTSFAGNNEDTTTNLYDAYFREYGIQGRWPSPDPAGTAAANPANPQSWNRYAYVMNNPLALIDPLGLYLILEEVQVCTPDTYSTGPNGETVVTDHCTDTIVEYDDGQGGGFSGSGGNGGGSGDGLVAPPPPRILTNPCANATLSAAGVNAQEQIAMAQGLIAAGKIGAGSSTFSNPVFEFFGGMFGYYEAVKPGGPNDIKNLPGHSGRNPIDVNAGNISFGITCPYGAGFCQFAAGFAQSVLHLDPNFNGTLATGFDTPSDNAGIRTGQAMRAAGCHE